MGNTTCSVSAVTSPLQTALMGVLVTAHLQQLTQFQAGLYSLTSQTYFIPQHQSLSVSTCRGYWMGISPPATLLHKGWPWIIHVTKSGWVRFQQSISPTTWVQQLYSTPVTHSPLSPLWWPTHSPPALLGPASPPLSHPCTVLSRRTPTWERSGMIWHSAKIKPLGVFSKCASAWSNTV